jgi:hypothetical protein
VRRRDSRYKRRLRFFRAAADQLSSEPTFDYLSSPIQSLHVEPADKRLVIDPYLTSEIFERPNEKREFVRVAAGSEMRVWEA